MSLLEETRLANLTALARDHFDPNLTDVELEVLRLSTRMLRPEEPMPDTTPVLTPETESSTNLDIANTPPATPPSSRPPVRSEFLRWLLTAPEVQSHIDPQGIHVYYATISDEIDLRRNQLLANLYFVDCVLEGKLRLNAAQARSIILYRCVFAGFRGPGLTTDGPLFILNSECSGAVNLADSSLGNALDCSGTKLKSRDSALSLDGATIQGDVLLNDGFESAGEVTGRNLRVRGDFNCTGAKLSHPECALELSGAVIDGVLFMKDAEVPEGFIRLVRIQIGGDFNCSGTHIGNGESSFCFDGASIGGGVHLRENFETARPVRCIGAKIGSDLNCSEAKFSHPESAINFGNATITGNVGFFNNFEASGEITGTQTSIGGDLDCTGAKLTNTKRALTLDASTIKGSIYLSENFISHGEISCIRLHVSGNFACSTAKLLRQEGALNIERATIMGSVFLNKGFEAMGKVSLGGLKILHDLICNDAKLLGTGIALDCGRTVIEGGVFLQRSEAAGELNFHGAHIGGDFGCAGTKLNDTTNGTLILIGAVVKRNVHLSDGFVAEESVSLAGATIEGFLNCNGAAIRLLYCSGMHLAGNFIWTNIQNPEKCTLYLLDARIKAVEDDNESWPARGSLALDGLIYDDLILRTQRASEGPTQNFDIAHVSTARIAWIKRQPRDYLKEPQPWVQLATTLEAKGEKRQARHVLYQFACYQADSHSPLMEVLEKSYAWLVEQPFRICWSIASILLLGTLLFNNAGLAGAMRPTNKDASEAWAKGHPMPNAYPSFNPLVYTLENELPLVKLGMDDKWAPDQSFDGDAYGKSQHYPRWRALAISYFGLSAARWLLILVGWIQATVLAASVSSRFRS